MEAGPGETPPIDSSGNGDGGTGEGVPFSEISGTERLVEATNFEPGDGSSRRRDEQFTSTFSLMVLDAEESQIFVGDVLTTRISGNLRGQAHLTYSESGTDVSAGGFDCSTLTYSGGVEWDVTVEGSYSFIPILDEISVLIPDRDHSSPEYTVTFTAPGCPELDSMSPSSSYWGGPGIGTWGGVSITLRNGSFDSGLDNVLGNDLGEEDFYEIHVELQP